MSQFVYTLPQCHLLYFRAHELCDTVDAEVAGDDKRIVSQGSLCLTDFLKRNLRIFPLPPIAGVSITVEFAGQTFTGITDANRVFTTGWVRKLSSGNQYSANVVAFDLVMTNYYWDTFMDLGDKDEDGDGVPDNILVL